MKPEIEYVVEYWSKLHQHWRQYVIATPKTVLKRVNDLRRVGHTIRLTTRTTRVEVLR